MYPQSFTSLVELATVRATEQPDAPAYLFLADGETESDRLTYGELDARARRIARRLQEQAGSPENIAGQPVLLCYTPGLEFIAAFFGCLYAGAIAVPAYAPDPHRLSRSLPRLQAILQDTGALYALTTLETLQTVGDWDLPGFKFSAFSWMATDTISATRSRKKWTPAAPDAAATAFLMYTSGSTGTPKGVIVSHANTLHNLSNFAGFEADQRPPTAFVSWLPFFHDLGLLLGILHPLYQAKPAILMPSFAFVQRPVRWLQAMSKYQASTTGGPNFAYDLCVRKSSPAERAALDLSHWNMALNGAEPIRAATLDSFAATFAPSGFKPETFYPSYGMAEATATIAGGPGYTPPLVYHVERAALNEKRISAAPVSPENPAFVGCGRILPGQTIVAVDPNTLEAVAPGGVGELWVQGPSIAQGYWQRPELTAEIFQARLSGYDGYFLRTGDLGFVYNEQVFLIGRLKDLIIIRGLNHYPEDIEQSLATAHSALRPGGGAAFSIEADGEERLVIVHEVHGDAPDTAEIFGNIRQLISEKHELDVAAIALLAPGEVPKTSSGKIQRNLARRRYLGEDGHFKLLALWQAPNRAARNLQPRIIESARPSATRPDPAVLAIENWLTEYFARKLDIPALEIDPTAPFTRYGLNSLQIINLVRDLEEWLARPLSPTVAWEHPTPAQLARHLAGITPENNFSSAPTAPTNAEPVAIIGMGCRFPGAPDVEAFWKLLKEGRDAVTEIPGERWDNSRYFDPQPGVAGKTLTRWGGFLERLAEFDANFFGISPREAAHLDPRQRVIMETAWEALEDAGIAPDSLAGSRTAVFMAALSNDYDQLLFKDLHRVDAYSGPGTANAIISNRLSYVLDLRGPSLTLDTACSGSLVAVHLACRSIQSGESELALVGGVNINLLPNGNIFFSKAGVISPDGKCKTFDARANGIARSEGAGVVVLKPLSKALADGDPVYAVIHGSAVNSDGRSNGLMAPNRAAQEAVLREAYGRARLSPDVVQYIEAHGTGTALGDPIEVQALHAVLGENRDTGLPPIALGSLKTNFGHMEAAAGIAGLIKLALSIKHRALPPSLNFEKPNPLIPFDRIPFRVQTEFSDWASPRLPLVAGISGFGFGGTNAHVVVGEAPAPAKPANYETAKPGTYLLPLSAKSAAALSALAAKFQIFAEDTNAELPDAAYSAARRRAHHDYRLAVTGSSFAEIVGKLQAYGQGEARPGLAASPRRVGRQPRTAFVFSGQGSHWYGMGTALYRDEPVFRATLNECDRLVRKLAGWSLLAEIEKPAGSSELDQTDYAQPAIFAVQVALAALWQSWGILPDVIVGQSLGEIAAAHVAGALSLEDAMRVVVVRSRLMKRVAGQGKTALVGLPLEKAALALTGWEDMLAVAGSSSPEASVLSGDPSALDRVLASLEKQGVFCRALKGVDIAFHSPQMDALVPELVGNVVDIQPRRPTVPLYSTVTAAEQEAYGCDAAYWGRNLRQPFRFADTLAVLLEQGVENFIEVSPHPVVASSVMEGARFYQKPNVTTVASLRRDEPERATLLSGLGTLYTLGFNPNWARLYPADAHICTKLPTYAWQREYYWYDQLDIGAASSPSRSSRRQGSHPLLGERFALAGSPGAYLWEGELSVAALPYMEEHIVQGVAMLPGSAYVEMAHAAGKEVYGACGVRDLVFKQAFFLPKDSTRQVQLTLTPAGLDYALFEVYSRPADVPNAAWTLHAQAKILDLSDAASEIQIEMPSLGQMREACPDELPAAAHYAAMASWGYHYGESFQAITDIWRRDGLALGKLSLPANLTDGAAYGIHPVLLDNSFQLVSAALPAEESAPGAGKATPIPIGVDRTTVLRPLDSTHWCYVVIRAGLYEANRQIDLYLINEDGAPAVIIEGLRFQKIGKANPQAHLLKNPLYEISWQPRPLDTKRSPVAPGDWLVITSSSLAPEFVKKVTTGIETSGNRIFVITAAAGQPYRFDKAGHAAFDPQESGHFRQLFADLVVTGWSALRGIIYLPGVAPELSQNPVAAYDFYSLSVLYLSQALLQRPAGLELPRLWLATAPEYKNPAAASLWGFGRVLALEHPELWGGLLQLENLSDQTVTTLVAEILTPDGEDQFRVADDDVKVARLERYITPKKSGGLPVRADGAYLITGGFGGLGLAVACYLAQNGARRLILTGREPLPPRSQWSSLALTDAGYAKVAAVRELESLGVSVNIARFDIADESAFSNWLDAYEREAHVPIRGIVHSAGILHDRLVMQMDTAGFRNVSRPKVSGGWLLHRLFENRPLDFFVTFSSAASVVGSFGQANYAAANAFMDALAHYRRARGLPALSLNWGPWAEIGMASGTDLAEEHARRGMVALPPENGLEIFGELLRQPGVGQVAVMAADWGLVKAALPPRVEARLLARLLESVAPLAEANASTGNGNRPVDRLAQIADATEREVALTEYLRETVAGVLKLDKAKLDSSQTLTGLGMDSIMAVELKNRLETGLGVTFSLVELLQDFTVTGGVARIMPQIAVVDATIANLLDELDGLSVEEMEALLAS
jgi:acyl transferase domain-containing protein/acyl-CoA synthetase (AMP-forming)/AMP-acid ligase II/acyl carrier protein